MNATPTTSFTLDSLNTLHKIYKLENRELVQVTPLQNLELQERFMQGWVEQNCTYPGGSVCRFLEAKCFTCIPPVG